VSLTSRACADSPERKGKNHVTDFPMCRTSSGGNAVGGVEGGATARVFVAMIAHARATRGDTSLLAVACPIHPMHPTTFLSSKHLNLNLITSITSPLKKLFSRHIHTTFPSFHSFKHLLSIFQLFTTSHPNIFSQLNTSVLSASDWTSCPDASGRRSRYHWISSNDSLATVRCILKNLTETPWNVSSNIIAYASQKTSKFSSRHQTNVSSNILDQFIATRGRYICNKRKQHLQQ
jgi:hypothetical protein